MSSGCVPPGLHDDGRQIIHEIYSAYHSAMLGRAMTYVHNLWDAEDIVSDCCVSLMRHTPLLQQMNPARRTGYIMASVRNTALGHLRKRSRAPLLCPDELLDAYASPVHSIEAEIAREMAADLLGALTGREGEVAQLRLQRMPTKEIALKLDLSESAVRVCWHRARKKMRQMLSSSEAG